MKFSAFALVPLAAVLANAQKFKFCNVGQQGCAYTNDVSDDTDRNVLLLTNDTTAPNQNWVKYSPSGENIIVHNANTDQFLTVYRAPKPMQVITSVHGPSTFIVLCGNGQCQISDRNSSMCLEAGVNKLVVLKNCTSPPLLNQLWEFDAPN